MAHRKTMITMGSPYFVWINTNEILSLWYLLGVACVGPPGQVKASGLVEALVDEFHGPDNGNLLVALRRWKLTSHSDTTLYVSLVVLNTKCTGRRQNDFNVHG
jgi:hypothetical protein